MIENNNLQENELVNEGEMIDDTAMKADLEADFEALDRKTKKLQNSPDIISRGFVYLRESQDLLAETRKKTRNIIKNASKGKKSNAKSIKKEMQQKIEDFLYSKTRRKPIVLPVVIEI
jgi:ribonuclease J